MARLSSFLRATLAPCSSHLFGEPSRCARFATQVISITLKILARQYFQPYRTKFPGKRVARSLWPLTRVPLCGHALRASRPMADTLSHPKLMQTSSARLPGHGAEPHAHSALRRPRRPPRSASPGKFSNSVTAKGFAFVQSAQARSTITMAYDRDGSARRLNEH